MRHWDTLYFATTSAGKLRDLCAAAGDGAPAILPLPGLDWTAAPAEEADTFDANARDKAVYYSRSSPGKLVLADDSGLEVDALNGAPGVRSARYAADAGFEAPGAPEADERNNIFLLQELADCPEVPRSARYRCALAAALDGSIVAVSTGVVEGRILMAPRGRGGFGYDPLFLLPSLGRTMAEIDLSERNRLSHRGNALRALLASGGLGLPSSMRSSMR